MNIFLLVFFILITTINSSCPIGQYLSASSTCQFCDFTCQTCNGATSSNCLSCNQLDRTLTGSACPCKSGVQDSSGNCVASCTDVGCDLCTVNSSICQQCKPTFILSGGKCRCPLSYYYFSTDNACYPCDTTCAICSGPSANQCTGCSSTNNRQLNTTSFSCQCKATFYAPNNELVCIKQPSLSCPTFYTYNATTGYCDQICGDGKLFQLECDDGNTDSGDGCNQYCKVEPNFSCIYGDSQSPSICSYDGQITFLLDKAQKQMYKNQIKLQYNLSPTLSFYQRFPDFTTSLSTTNSSISIKDATYSTISKKLLITLQYKQAIKDKSFTITYTPVSSPYSHALVSCSYVWNAEVQNNLSLVYNSDIVYSNAQIYDFLTLGYFIGTLFVYVLSLFFRKMIGIQMIILAQTQVLSVVILKQIHPYLSSLITDKYIFGYNGFEDLMQMKRSVSPVKIDSYAAIGFSPIFGQNVNIMVLAIAAFYFLAILVRLISACTQKGTSKKMKQAALIFARQIAFGLLLFSLINMVTSYALQSYQNTIWNYDPQYSGTIKIGCIILIVANYLVYGIYFKQSVESYVFYQKRSRLAQLQPLFIATKAIMIAAGISLYHLFGPAIFYSLISLQVLYIVFVIILRPFKRVIDLIRSITIQITLGYILTSRFLLRQYINLQNPGDWNTFIQYGIPLQYCLIGLSLLMSFISLIFHLVKANKADTQINPQQLFSQVDLLEQKQNKMRLQKQNTVDYPINDYLQNYLQQDSPKKLNPKKILKNKSNKLFSRQQIDNNNSIMQMFNSTDREGQSKRRLNDTMAQSMQIIQMDE